MSGLGRTGVCPCFFYLDLALEIMIGKPSTLGINTLVY